MSSKQPDASQNSDDLFGRPTVPLVGQIERVYNVLKTGCWLTLPEIHGLTKDPIPSISAQIRSLRKPEGGGHRIEKRRRGISEQGLFEYRMIS